MWLINLAVGIIINALLCAVAAGVWVLFKYLLGYSFDYRLTFWIMFILLMIFEFFAGMNKAFPSKTRW